MSVDREIDNDISKWSFNLLNRTDIFQTMGRLEDLLVEEVIDLMRRDYLDVEGDCSGPYVNSEFLEQLNCLEKQISYFKCCLDHFSIPEQEVS